MRKLFLLFSGIWPLALAAQAIISTNLNHQYNPNCEIQVRMHVVRHANQIQVLYQLETISTVSGLDAYSIKWEKRDNFSDRAGTVLTNDSISSASARTRSGKLIFEIPEKPWLLVLSVTNTANPRTYLFPKLIEANYPVQGTVLENGQPVWNRYVTKNSSITYHGSPGRNRARVYRYKVDFPIASPPFAEKENRVDPLLVADSLFWIEAQVPTRLTTEALYLIQEDTTKAQGVAFRVENETYPKLSRIADLAPPLIFLTTREEFERLAKTGGNKAEFDKVVIEITKDKERAKTFMRSYYRRVELANQYFTAYKEGWKTDRGMIYLIFGLPDDVTYTGGTEVWNYRSFDSRFTFVKNGSIYSPDNFILVRDKRFAESWYSTIDLWRKSRF
jgi:GWxTD domain-containing protein